MGVIFQYLLLTTVVITIAFGAPADEKSEKIETEVVPVSKKSTTTEERGVIAVDQSWETFFGGNTMNVLGGALGTVLVLGGLGLAFYYFYYLNYYSGDYQNLGYNSAAYPYNPQTGSYQTQQYYPPIGRSLDTGSSSWNWPQVIYMISLAQESYEKFDFQTLDCQKKALCELSQKQNDFGETGRKVSNTFSFLDAVEGLPMPTIILTYLKEYREAINQGRNSNKECALVYPKCNFSLKEVFVKYQKRAAGEKF